VHEGADERNYGEHGENDGEPRPHAGTVTVPV
jgi:hypothetical protein